MLYSPSDWPLTYVEFVYTKSNLKKVFPSPLLGHYLNGFSFCHYEYIRYIKKMLPCVRYFSVDMYVYALIITCWRVRVDFIHAYSHMLFVLISPSSMDTYLYLDVI